VHCAAAVIGIEDVATAVDADIVRITGDEDIGCGAAIAERVERVRGTFVRTCAGSADGDGGGGGGASIGDGAAGEGADGVGKDVWGLAMERRQDAREQKEEKTQLKRGQTVGTDQAKLAKETHTYPMSIKTIKDRWNTE
jgi:hypothetical protein